MSLITVTTMKVSVGSNGKINCNGSNLVMKTTLNIGDMY